VFRRGGAVTIFVPYGLQAVRLERDHQPEFDVKDFPSCAIIFIGKDKRDGWSTKR
jgi:hypothetical protein